MEVLYIALGVVAVGLIFLVIIVLTTKAVKKEVDKNMPIILENEAKVKAQLQKENFIPSYTATYFGYPYGEYKKRNAPNNINLLIDEEKAMISCYTLLPYYLKICTLKNLLKYELVVNSGQVETSSSSLASGTVVGGVGIGSSTTSGTAKQRINSIVMQLYFDDDDVFEIDYLNKSYCYQGDERYREAMTNAKKMQTKLDKILENYKK